MRLLIVVSAAAMLSACGGGSGNQPASNAEPDIKADKRPSYLLIRSAKSGDAIEMYLNDETTPSNLDAFKKAIKEHAARKDLASGLPGPDKDGFSANLIVFRAPPDASSLPFFAIAELASRVLAYRIHAQLEVSRSDPMEVHVDLRNAGPGFRPIRGALSTGPGDPVPFTFGIGRSDPQLIAGVAFTIDEVAKGGWNPEEYSRVRAALVASLQEHQEKLGEWCDEIAVSPVTVDTDRTARSDYASWAAVFVAVDAIGKIEPPKGKLKPKVGLKSNGDAYLLK
jgi:hypothetical protein